MASSGSIENGCLYVDATFQSALIERCVAWTWSGRLTEKQRIYVSGDLRIRLKALIGQSACWIEIMASVCVYLDP